MLCLHTNQYSGKEFCNDFLRPCYPLAPLQGCDIDKQRLHIPINVLVYCIHSEYEIGKCPIGLLDIDIHAGNQYVTVSTDSFLCIAQTVTEENIFVFFMLLVLAQMKLLWVNC